VQFLDALRSFRKNILPGEIRPAKQAKPSLFSFLSCAIFSSKKLIRAPFQGKVGLGGFGMSIQWLGTSSSSLFKCSGATFHRSIHLFHNPTIGP